MNTINRIKKITEAHDHIDQAINLILGTVSGLSVAETVQIEVVFQLDRLIDDSIDDGTSLQDIIKEILK
jgi:hypothetical protein